MLIQEFFALPRLTFRRRALALAAGLMACGVVNAADPSREKVVALAVEEPQVLLKAYPRALLRSDDDGRTWTTLPLPSLGANQRIAAIAVAARRKGAWYVAGPGVGVLRSDDGGKHWVARNQGLPGKDILALATHVEQPDTVYANVVGKGFFRSQDAGAHWKMMDAGPQEPATQFVHSNMPGSMQTGWLFAATVSGVARSMDCFCGWRPAGTLAAEVRAVAYDPGAPKHVYAATAQGLFLSTDGGEQWTRTTSPDTAITGLTFAPSGVLFAAGDDLFRSRDGGKTWERVGG